MSRRRYISTEICTDAKINQVSDLAALLYTWAIPHFADNCRITPKNAAECRWSILPGRKCTEKQVEKAMNELFAVGLWGRDGDGAIFIPSNSFYKFQTYINAANRRETPQIAASSSLSLSLSSSPSLKEEKTIRVWPGFDEFWQEYPKKRDKVDARDAWNKLKPDEDLQVRIIAAVARQRLWHEWTKEGGKYIPHPTKWIVKRKWEDQEVEVKPEENGKIREALRRGESFLRRGGELL